MDTSALSGNYLLAPLLETWGRQDGNSYIE
jgi:hypothetical protein